MKSLFENEVETRINEKQSNKKKRSYLLTGIIQKQEGDGETGHSEEVKQDCGDGMRLESQSFKPNKIAIINLHEQAFTTSSGTNLQRFLRLSTPCMRPVNSSQKN